MHKLMMAAALAALPMAAPGLAWAEGVMHKVAVHVDQNNPKVMNMALNNVKNLQKYYASQGDELTVEVVAYGPGLNMFVKDKSPVSDRIAAMSLELDHVKFSACGNTHAKMEQKAGHDVPLISEAEVVPSGVVRLVELQEDGYSYVKP
ncbi:DsrE family protein [Aquicoccus sp. G2-2]|uniref:DsrE family protein n=1 Tax=Aquicoccus sp. G2-2 TaxID=3092120 RepID=UPI002AE0931F|nr:DsrE family protein [Aquicoccus sp. G2-2]MEA1113801.1 DsrE family protein [Aquicoccus sp. G2-2]